MAQREREILKHGTARTKVAGDEEMLRTGFHNGTPLEAGKIADSQPVDLFAPAHRAPSSDQQQHGGDINEGNRVIAESEPVDLLASARGDKDGKAAAPAIGRQGMAAGGRRLGRQS